MDSNIRIRKLELNDFYKGYMELLSELTLVNLNISFSEFEAQYNNMTSHIFVLYDNFKNRVIGTGSVFIETKFIRNFLSVAHIEDIVIDTRYRGRGYGKILIDHLVEFSKSMNIYKIILDCSEDNVTFYEKCGFSNKGVQMGMYVNI